MDPAIGVSIVICTRNRAVSLARTLADLARQDLSGCVMEVLVVDNGSADETAELLRSQHANLRLIPLYEGIAGKSRCLNLALARVSGELILFTDDDVSFDRSWVGNYVAAARKFPQCALFCGPIVPDFPSGTAPWLQTHEWSSPFFGRFNVERPEGLLPDEYVPLGGNFAVRSKAIAGMEYRMDLGPSEINGKLMGEDVEFAQRVRNRWRDCVYVPSAAVRHHIRPEQITPPWLYDRAFIFGKSVMRLKDHATIPPFVPDDSAIDADGRHLDQACLIHFFCGQLAACTSTNTSVAAHLKRAICSLDLVRYGPILSPEANGVLGSVWDPS